MALTTTLVCKKFSPTDIPNRASGYISGTYTAATVNSATSPSTTATGGGIANSDAVSNVLIAAGVITITLGFVPKHFKIVNVTDRLTQEWFEGMNTGDFIETVAAGDQTLETDDQISVNATTGVVTITAAGGAMTDNDTVIWYAEG